MRSKQDVKCSDTAKVDNLAGYRMTIKEASCAIEINPQFQIQATSSSCEDKGSNEVSLVLMTWLLRIIWNVAIR